MLDFSGAEGGKPTLGVGAGMLLSSLVGAAGQGISNIITRRREDTAVQRRAADMEAAGINPTLAAGAPAQAQPLKGALTEGAEKAALGLAMMQQKKNISLTEAQTANVQADTAAKQLANQFGSNTVDARTSQAIAEACLTENRLAADRMMADWTQPDGSVSRVMAYQIEGLARIWDANIKAADMNRATIASDLEQRLYNEVIAGNVTNPALSQAMSKALALKLLEKENKYFWAGKALGGLSQATGIVGSMAIPFK